MRKYLNKWKVENDKWEIYNNWLTRYPIIAIVAIGGKAAIGFLTF